MIYKVRRTMLGGTLGAGLLVLAGATAASAQRAQQSPTAPANYEDAGKPIAEEPGYRDMNVANGFTVATVGDLLIKFPAMAYPETKQIAAILQKADVAAGNMENILHDERTYTLPTINAGPLGAMTGEPGVAKDLKSMGIDMVGRANNIVSGYGIEGMRETSRWLDDAEIVHAGTGETLGQARAARYLNTGKGRVAIVSFASSFESLGMAQDPNGLVPGLPGLSPLRMRREVIVTQQQMDALRAIRGALPGGTSQSYDTMTASQISTPVSNAAHKLNMFGTWYKVGDKPGYDYVLNKLDEDQILQGIRNGKANSDFLVAAVHSHEGPNPVNGIARLAHEAIDAGADMWLGTGPHVLRGIEIYKGRPIFYSLGDFFFQIHLMGQPVSRSQYEGRLVDPAVATDADYQSLIWNKVPRALYLSVIAVSKFDNDKLSEIRLYPIELNQAARPADRGRPRLANAETGRLILKELQTLSSPYGTDIRIEGSIGVIRTK